MKPIWVSAVAALLAAAPLTGLAAGPAASSAEVKEPVRAVQPVQEYFTPFAAGSAGDGRDFSSLYTHIGTDFGRMGPGDHRIAWESGAVRVDLRDSDYWTGMWHSLAGRAVEKSEALDFRRCYPRFIRDAYQPRCVGINLRVAGHGRIKVELKSADGPREQPEQALHAWTVDVDDDSVHEVKLDCDPAQFPRVKFLNWVAEPGSRVSVHHVGLWIEYPKMSRAERVFLTAYAKLARCYVETNLGGIVKDHQHREPGAFDAIPATGMFALATAAASRMDMVDRQFAQDTLRNIRRTVSGIGRAEGLLPHFVERARHDGRRCGKYHIHPGTEYSTVDTSLYFHGMLLASQILRDSETQAGLLEEVRAISFERLRDEKGWISHGLREDGKTSIGWWWTDWGGEAALVLLLERLAERPDCQKLPNINQSGKVPGGIGFVGEVQSLFYRDFDNQEPDAITHVSWKVARVELLHEQMAYFVKNKPESPAAKLGLYGLSAGEGYRSRAYVVNGTQFPGADLIHPHYILMSGLLRPPDDTYKLLDDMEKRGLMPPWGLVENVKADLSEYSPLLGSLNAAFECLGAYHLCTKALGRPDSIYDASRESEPLARAVSAFYPPRKFTTESTKAEASK